MALKVELFIPHWIQIGGDCSCALLRLAHLCGHVRITGAAFIFGDQALCTDNYKIQKDINMSDSEKVWVHHSALVLFRRPSNCCEGKWGRWGECGDKQGQPVTLKRAKQSPSSGWEYMPVMVILADQLLSSITCSAFDISSTCVASSTPNTFLKWMNVCGEWWVIFETEKNNTFWWWKWWKWGEVRWGGWWWKMDCGMERERYREGTKKISEEVKKMKENDKTIYEKRSK